MLKMEGFHIQSGIRKTTQDKHFFLPFNSSSDVCETRAQQSKVDSFPSYSKWSHLC